MGTIAENLQAILDAKTAIATSIAGKGITVPEGAKLNAFPTLIDSIEQGGTAAKNPEIVDLVFNNPVENHDSCNVDVVVRIMSYGSSVSNCGIQYRQKGTTEWITATTPSITDNSDTKTQHGFDKIATTTISNLLYQQSYNSTLGALVENNNRYEVRGYITYGTETIYSIARIYITGWSKFFDDIYNNANNLELEGTKQKRYIAVMPTANASKVLSQLSGDYYYTSDGYLGLSENHTFNESLDIPIYNIDGITIKYYVRWIIVYSSVSSPSITINDGTNRSYFYCYFGNCTISSLAFNNNQSVGCPLENLRFSVQTLMTSINNNAFSYCSSLTSIIIPSSVTSIGSNAFINCVALTSIIIPSSVTSIGEGAFRYCIVIISVNIPSSVTSISNMILYYCYSLISVIIPGSVTSIGAGAFQYCYSLTSIIVPSSLTTLNDSMFAYCTALTSIIIPSSVTSIGCYTFQGCTALTSIIIPSSVTSIGGYTFRYCTALTSIIIPSSVKSISDYLFSSCTALISIIIPNSVTSIGAGAFQYCSALTSIIIPSSVTSIGAGAFDGDSLTSISIPNSITSFPTTAIFNGCKNLYIVVIPTNWNKTINLITDTSYTANSVLTHKSIINIFNNLASGVSGKTLSLGAANLARMSAEEKLIATNKGWTLN